MTREMEIQSLTAILTTCVKGSYVEKVAIQELKELMLLAGRIYHADILAKIPVKYHEELTGP